MNSEHKYLYKGEHVNLVSPKERDYEFVHELDAIVCIPILYTKEGPMIVVRKELCPPYSSKDVSSEDLYYTLLTGKIDNGEHPFEAMQREIMEEAGISVGNIKVRRFKENVPICKTTNMRAHFYVFTTNDYEVLDPIGDGSYWEEQSETYLIDIYEYSEYKDKENVDFLFWTGFYLTREVLL